MIDTKSKLVLQILAKESGDGSYKIVEISDIIMALPRHFRLDSESVKHILTHLERQDIISIKYDDDGVYCLCVLPFGNEILESEFDNKKKDEGNFPRLWLLIFIIFCCCLVSSSLSLLLAYILILH